MTFKEYYLISEAKAIDAIQAALDVAGIEPTYGTIADAANVAISGLRAALTKEKDQRKRHIINAGLSAISLIPFADVIKILKLRRSHTATRAAIKGARALKTASRGLRASSRFEDQKPPDVQQHLSKAWRQQYTQD
jgi:hypothetical protein